MEELLARIGQLIATGRGDEAVVLVDALEPTDAAGHALGQAALAAARHQGPQCLEHARRAEKLRPNDPVVQQYLAVAHAQVGDHATAERHARRALALAPTPRSYGALANVLLGAGRLDDAEKAYRDLLTRDAENVQALSGLGLIRYRRGDLPGALGFYARAFEADPEDTGALQSITHMLGEAGWTLGALALGRMMRAGGGQSPEVAATLDVVLLKVATLALAQFGGQPGVPQLDPLITDLLTSSDDRAPRLQLQAARLLMDLGRVDPARVIATRLGEWDLDDADQANLSYVLGLLAEQAGDSQAALDRYVASVERDPTRWDACCNAVTLLLERSDVGSFARIPELLRRVPADVKATRPQLLFNEAVYLRRSKRFVEARRLLETIVQMTGGRGSLADLARKTLTELSDE